jgi:geranylgeranyl transferase type-1 subunit beta
MEESHIVMTYSSLAMVLLFGDDLSLLDAPRLVSCLKSLKMSNGGVRQTALRVEFHLRFSFWAAAITRMLATHEDLDVERTIACVVSYQTYDGRYEQLPLDKAHGGRSFCAAAALDLCGAFDRVMNRRTLAY